MATPAVMQPNCTSNQDARCTARHLPQGGLGGTLLHARWGVVANGSNGEMCSLCTIDLNPIVSRDSMLFSLLFDDRVAVKPGNREKIYGTRRLRANRPRSSGSAQRVCKMAGQRAAAFPSKRVSLFFCTAPNPSSRRPHWQHRSDK